MSELFVIHQHTCFVRPTAPRQLFGLVRAHLTSALTVSCNSPMRPTTPPPPPQSPAPSVPTTPQQALITVSQVPVPVPASAWRPILEASGQLVLYNPTSHALSITQHSLPPSNSSRGHDHASQRCPYCSQFLQADARLFSRDRGEEDQIQDGRRHTRRAPNYFQLLELANTEGYPRPSSPPQLPQNGEAPQSEEAPTGFLKGSMAQGYFSAFFREERRIGEIPITLTHSVHSCSVFRNGCEWNCLPMPGKVENLDTG
jgi:hypothetical protein